MRFVSVCNLPKVKYIEVLSSLNRVPTGIFKQLQCKSDKQTELC